MRATKPLIYLFFSSSILLSACGEKPESTVTSQPKPSNSSVEVVKVAQQAQTKAVQPVQDRGEKLYKRCRTCHTLNENGANKSGPNLFGIFGATAGQNPKFRYSKTMKESGLVWTDENLAAFLKKPSKFMPGNSMSFAGFRNDDDVTQLLEYLRQKTAK